MESSSLTRIKPTFPTLEGGSLLKGTTKEVFLFFFQRNIHRTKKKKELLEIKTMMAEIKKEKNPQIVNTKVTGLIIKTKTSHSKDSWFFTRQQDRKQPLFCLKILTRGRGWKQESRDEFQRSFKGDTMMA